jgi:hypothetical protein
MTRVSWAWWHVVLLVACGGNNDSPTPVASGGGSGQPAAASAGANGITHVGDSATAGAEAGTGGGGNASVAGAAGSSAGSWGGGTGGTAPVCLTSGKQLCEDFEGGVIDAARWQQTKQGSAQIVVDDVHAHGGRYAAHLKLEAGKQSVAMLTESVTFPAANNSFYARAYLYFTPAPGGDFHMGFILGIGKNDAGDVQAGAGMIGGEKQYLGYSIFFGPPKYEFGPWSKAKVEPGRWQCLELFEDGSSPSEEKRQVWLDGVELTDLRSTSANQGAPANHKPPTWSGASFGVWEYHPSPLLSDVWLDDIRVSDDPIGCD